MLQTRPHSDITKCPGKEIIKQKLKPNNQKQIASPLRMFILLKQIRHIALKQWDKCIQPWNK